MHWNRCRGSEGIGTGVEELKAIGTDVEGLKALECLEIGAEKLDAVRHLVIQPFAILHATQFASRHCDICCATLEPHNLLGRPGICIAPYQDEQNQEFGSGFGSGSLDKWQLRWRWQ